MTRRASITSLTGTLGLFILGAVMAVVNWFGRNSELSIAEVLGCSVLAALVVVTIWLVLAGFGG